MNPTKQKKCFVTGGAGFIGSHLVDRLIELGHEVTVVDDLSTGKRENVNIGARFFANRKRKENPADSGAHVYETCNDLEMFHKHSDYDYIFHLAAVASVPATFNNPVASHDTNVTATLTLLDALSSKASKHKIKPKKFVFASSSAVYGDAPMPEKGFSESGVVSPMSPYAIQKYAAEQYCETYRKNFDIPTVSLRFFNVFGPRQNGSGAYSNVISSWFQNIAEGKNLRLDGDGSQSRDFIYVKNVVNILIESAFSEKISGVYNVGSGDTRTVASILENYKDNFYLHNKISFAKERLGDPKITKADLTKFYKDFSSESARFTNFELALGDTRNFYFEQERQRKEKI